MHVQVALSCLTGSIPLSPLSYYTINSHVFNGTRPSDQGCTNSTSLAGQSTIECGQRTALLNCDSGFNGGNFSNLSNRSIFTWNWTTPQVSLAFKFDQQISINVIHMTFWNSPSHNIIIPNVTVYWSDDNSTTPTNEITHNVTTNNDTAVGLQTLNIHFAYNELKLQYLRIMMDVSEWVFLSEVEFCGE